MIAWTTSTPQACTKPRQKSTCWTAIFLEVIGAEKQKDSVIIFAITTSPMIADRDGVINTGCDEEPITQPLDQIWLTQKVEEERFCMQALMDYEAWGIREVYQIRDCESSA